MHVCMYLSDAAVRAVHMHMSSTGGLFVFLFVYCPRYLTVREHASRLFERPAFGGVDGGVLCI